MAIHTPNVFHNTIGVASIESSNDEGFTPVQDVPYPIVPVSPSETLTPKNIKNTLTALRFTTSWLGYYLITFNATASGGTDKLWYFEPYKNGVALGYGNVFYYQQNISGVRVPYYEISATFIAKLQKDDYIEFYNTLKSADAPSEALIFQNIQTTIYQLEQVGIH